MDLCPDRDPKLALRMTASGDRCVSFGIVPYWSPLSIEIEMREIFGKMSPISREIFLEMGELILICTGVADAMVCPVVILALR